MNYEDFELFCLENCLDFSVFNKNKKGLENHCRIFDEYGNYLLDVFFKYKGEKCVRNTILIWKTLTYIKINSILELSSLLNSNYDLKTSYTTSQRMLF